MVLHTWNSLVETMLNPSNKALDSLSEEGIILLIKQVEDEQEKIRNLLIESIIDKPKISDKQHYVQINQAMLIRLLDKVHSYKDMVKLHEKAYTLYDTIIQYFQNTLDFIEEFFNNYFDRNKKVPISYLIISLEELCRHLDSLKIVIQTRAINQELSKIVFRNFNRFCQQKTGGATYNQLVYQKELMNELLT